MKCQENPDEILQDSSSLGTEAAWNPTQIQDSTDPGISLFRDAMLVIVGILAGAGTVFAVILANLN